MGYPGIPIIGVTGKILHMSAPTPGQHPTDLFGAVPHSSSFSKAVLAVQVATTSAWGSWAASSVKRLRHFKCSNAWATSLCELEEIEMPHNFQSMKRLRKLFQRFQLFHSFHFLQLPSSTNLDEPRQGPATQQAQRLRLPSSWEAAWPLEPLADWVQLGQGPKHRGFAAGDQSEPISISVWVYTHTDIYIYIYIYIIFSLFIYLSIYLFIYLCLCTVGVGAQVLGYVHIAPATRSVVYFGWECFHHLAQGQQLTCYGRRTLHLLLAKRNISRKKCVCQIRSSSSRSYSGKSWTLGFAHLQSEIGFNSLKVKGLVLLTLSQMHCRNPKNVESNLSLFL